MRKLVFIALPALAVIGLGAIAFGPDQGTARSNDAAGLESAARHTSKSDRPPERAGAQSRQPLFEEVDRELNRLQSARAAAPREGRTFVLPPRVESAQADDRKRDSVIHSNSPSAPNVQSPEKKRAARGPDLAEQMIAQNRNRKEYLRQRYAELASHEPGCKCAYHVGKK